MSFLERAEMGAVVLLGRPELPIFILQSEQPHLKSAVFRKPRAGARIQASELPASLQEPQASAYRLDAQAAQTGDWEARSLSP